jgi:hypothetical protein
LKWSGVHVYLSKGGKDGKLLATVSRNLFGSNTSIMFADEKEISMNRKLFRGFISKGRFMFDGKDYEWKGYSPLKLMQGDKLVAQVARSALPMREQGYLEIYEDGAGMLDLILITFSHGVVDGADSPQLLKLTQGQRVILRLSPVK